jgi:hypothetical protein
VRPSVVRGESARSETERKQSKARVSREQTSQNFSPSGGRGTSPDSPFFVYGRKEKRSEAKSILAKMSEARRRHPCQNDHQRTDAKNDERPPHSQQRLEQAWCARRPEGQKARRPEGQKARRPEGQKARRPEGQKARRPEGQKATRPEGQKATRPEGQKARRPQGQKARRPEGQRAREPKDQIVRGPESQRTREPEGQEGQRARRPESQRAKGPGGPDREKATRKREDNYPTLKKYPAKASGSGTNRTLGRCKNKSHPKGQNVESPQETKAPDPKCPEPFRQR